MTDSQIRIAIAGSGGRMGRQLIQAVQQAQGVWYWGQRWSARVLAWLAPMPANWLALVHWGVTVSDNLEKVVSDFDILIDFTRPEGTLAHLAFCVAHGKAMVIAHHRF
ncbi:Dihydrodipicolinate reductase [Serratia fonticola]|uniref:Dihydrodipicolinate reductase n=1 Tax=Serratia fonticola TaxID=47917 RepID=A0A4U9UC16_SERFO|nr:Dihydrodipicolinate reductase [Serratia fonticola]